MPWSTTRTKPKPAHHRGSHQVRARAVVTAAYANPHTRCWRCGNTLPNCRPHRNGKPARWQAGHINDGQQDGPLAAECSPCNSSAGARLGSLRSQRTRRQQRANVAYRTELTW